MKRVTRFISLILTIAMIASFFVVSASAAAAPLKLEAKESGEQLIVSAIATSNFSLRNFEATMDYDKTAFSIESDEDIETSVSTEPTTNKGTAMIAYSANKNKDVKSNEAFITYTFAVGELESGKKYTFTLQFGAVAEAGGVSLDWANSSVTTDYTWTNTTPYNITGLGSTTGGSVSATINAGSAVTRDTTAKEGDAIVLTVEPSANYGLTKLEVGGVDVTTQMQGKTYAFTMPAKAVEVKASFRAETITATASISEPAVNQKYYKDDQVAVTIGNATSSLSGELTGEHDVVVKIGSQTVYSGTAEFQAGGATIAENKTNKLVVGSGVLTVTIDNKAAFTGTDTITVNDVATHTVKTATAGAGKGTITVDPDSFTEVATQRTVTVTVTPAKGSTLTKVEYVEAGETKPVQMAANNGVSTGAFTMPKADVTVTATFGQETKTITKGSGVSAVEVNEQSAETAAYGDAVTVTPTAAQEGKVIMGVEYTTSSERKNAATANGDGTYSFTMPAEAVTVTTIYGTVVKFYEAQTTTEVADSVTVADGTEKVTLPTPTAKENAVFNGWSTTNAAAAPAGLLKSGTEQNVVGAYYAYWTTNKAEVEAAVEAAVDALQNTVDTDVDVEKSTETGATEASVAAGADIPASEIKNVTDAAKGLTLNNVTAPTGGSSTFSTANSAESKALTDAAKDTGSAVEELVKSGILTVTDDGQGGSAIKFTADNGDEVVADKVELKTEIYMDVEVLGYTSNEAGKTFEVDIQPMARVTATPVKTAGNVKGESVQLAEAAVKLETPATITIKLPFTANSADDLKLTHNPGTAQAEQIEDVIKTTTSVNFTSKDFSPYAVSEATNATYNGKDYDDAQAAVNAAAKANDSTNAVDVTGDKVDTLNIPTGKSVKIQNSKENQEDIALTGTRLSASKVAYGDEAVTVTSRKNNGGSAIDATTATGKPTVTTNNNAYGTVTTTINSVTVKPKDGYQVAKVTVNGKEVTLPANGTITGLSAADRVAITYEKVGAATDVLDLYTDVNKNEWYAPALRYVIENGYMTGVGETEFGPNTTISRGMIAKLLANMAGENTDPAANEKWYDKAVAWAVKNGIFDGTNPEAPALREEFATMLYNYVKTTGKGYTGDWSYTLTNPDADDVQAANREAMQWMVTNKVINGMDELGTLAPQGTTTRAQFAQMLLNLSNVK